MKKAQLGNITKNLLSKTDIMNSRDLTTEIVDVPEWGGSVIVKTLTAEEREEFENIFIDSDGNRKPQDEVRQIRARLVALSLVDEDDERLFDSEFGVEELAKKNAATIDKLFNIAKRLSAIGYDEVAAITKNSEATQEEDSTTD